MNTQQFTDGYKQECNILLLFSAAMKINVKIYSCNESQLDALSSVYFVYQPLHVSGIFVARLNPANSTLPDDRFQICPKHAEVDRRNKLRINSASGWFSLYGYIEMHGQRNMKFNKRSKNKL
jgi:hypothetical protein